MQWNETTIRLEIKWIVWIRNISHINELYFTRQYININLTLTHTHDIYVNAQTAPNLLLQNLALSFPNSAALKIVCGVYKQQNRKLNIFYENHIKSSTLCVCVLCMHAYTLFVYKHIICIYANRAPSTQKAIVKMFTFFQTNMKKIYIFDWESERGAFCCRRLNWTRSTRP